MLATMKLNQELNGVEIYFPGKPAESIRSLLKQNKFRWSKYKRCWYAKQTEKTLKFAENLTNNSELITAPAKEEKTVSLWDLTRWEDIKISKEQKEQPIKEIAAEIRKHVKTRFKGLCKFSVRSSYNSISFYITESPFKKDSVYLEAIKNYCTKLLQAYNYCTYYDPYSDYGSTYNFYGNCANIAYNYKQTEQTKFIKEIIKDFNIKKAEHDKLEEHKRKEELRKLEEERRRKEEEYRRRLEQEKQQKQTIYNSIDIVALEEQDQYFVIDSKFANLNKQNTLKKYKEEVKKGDYTLQDIKITKEIHFKNKEAFDYFSNMLLHDFDFLAGTGGSYTEDPRINSITDYYNMDKEEQKTVVWLLQGVAIYFNNKLQFVVNAQGYNYARYVGLVEGATITKGCNSSQTVAPEMKN